MSVLEYAEDVNITVKEILNMCARLGIDVSGEDDYLDEEAITILDNDIAASEETEDLEYEDELIEKENSKIEDIVNNSKPKKGNNKKSTFTIKANFMIQSPTRRRIGKFYLYNILSAFLELQH